GSTHGCRSRPGRSSAACTSSPPPPEGLSRGGGSGRPVRAAPRTVPSGTVKVTSIPYDGAVPQASRSARQVSRAGDAVPQLDGECAGGQPRTNSTGGRGGDHGASSPAGWTGRCCE